MWPDKDDTSPRPLTKPRQTKATRGLVDSAGMDDGYYDRCVRLRSPTFIKPRKDTKLETGLVNLGECNWNRGYGYGYPYILKSALYLYIQSTGTI